MTPTGTTSAQVRPMSSLSYLNPISDLDFVNHSCHRTLHRTLQPLLHGTSISAKTLVSALSSNSTVAATAAETALHTTAMPPLPSSVKFASP